MPYAFARGPQGPQGEKGDKGETGPQGPQGEKGEPGASIEVDATLSKTGAAADAKATGDALNEAKMSQAELLDQLMIKPEMYGIPMLALAGDISDMSKDNAVTLAYTYGERTGTLTCKWQGSSSLDYPKKNYTIKFDTAFEAKPGWGDQRKYCLKANWVDASNIRNVFGAVLWGQMVKDRTGVDPKLSALSNGGAIDGFPVWVVINDVPQGLYMWNIPKDAWMFGMVGDSTNEGFVCAENTTFSDAAICDGTDFSIEYTASDDHTALIASLNNLIATVNNVQSSEDLPSLEALIDINSVIDLSLIHI